MGKGVFITIVMETMVLENGKKPGNCGVTCKG